MGLDAAAATAVEACLGLGAGESFAVVTDDERQPIGEALCAAARTVTDDAAIVRYPPGGQHGAEPPEPVAAAMRTADAVVAPTTKSLSHTRARERATEAGARVATMPGITEPVMIDGLDADYRAIAAACEAIHEQVAGADELRIETAAGTDLTVSPGEREWLTDTGVLRDPGAFSNLPAGETFVAPEGGDGRYVVDGTMASDGLVDDPFEIVVVDGFVTEIGHPAVREAVAEAEAVVGDAARNLAEVGIGANIGVGELVGSVLLDEKAAGTVHVAIGDDAGIGGDTEAPIHLDAVLREPTVYADGEAVELPGESRGS